MVWRLKIIISFLLLASFFNVVFFFSTKKSLFFFFGTENKFWKKWLLTRELYFNNNFIFSSEKTVFTHKENWSFLVTCRTDNLICFCTFSVLIWNRTILRFGEIASSFLYRSDHGPFTQKNGSLFIDNQSRTFSFSVSRISSAWPREN